MKKIIVAAGILGVIIAVVLAALPFVYVNKTVSEPFEISNDIRGLLHTTF